MSTAPAEPKPAQQAKGGKDNVVPIRPDKIGPGQLVPSTARVNLTAVTNPADPNFGLWVDGVHAAELPVVRARMPVRDSANKRRGWQYLLAAVGDDTAYLCSSKDLTTGEYADRVGLDVPEDRTIRDACVTVIRRMARDAQQREITAGWVEGRLTLPPLDALPPGYLETAGTEDEARRAWRRIGEIACLPQAEHLALNLGAAYAAPYPAALSNVRPVSFALVGIGGNRLGKTTNTNAAAGWYGAPLPINPVISESPVAVTDSLAALGILPFWRDEAHAVKWSPEQWKQHWMTNLNGGGRRRSSADGSGIVRHTRGWWGVQFLTGNFDPRFGATDGVQARVIALNTPHLPNGKVSDEITLKLLPGCYGWPIRWQLADHLSPEEMRKHAEIAYAEIAAACKVDGFALEHAADTVARSLALAVAGADQAGQLIDAPDLRAAAVRSALRVLRTLSDVQADQALHFGDQLHLDVTDDVQRYPGGWPTLADYELMRREQHSDSLNGGRISRGDVHGFRLQAEGGEVACMLRPMFAAMVAGRDYATDEALAELRKDGRLLTNRGTGFRYQKKINGTQEKFYAFRLSAVPTDDADSGDGSSEVKPAAPEPEITEVDMEPTDPKTEPQQPAPEPTAGGQDAGAVAGESSASTQVRSSAPGPRVGDTLGVCVACGDVPRTLWRDDQDQPRHPSCMGIVPPAPVVTAAVTSSAPVRRATQTRQVADARQVKQAAEVAEQLQALAEGRPLRLLRALETTHTPRKRNDRGRMSGPFRAPELPAVLDDVHVISSWAWRRPYVGEVTVLDRNASWPSAASSVEVAHGALEHTGADSFAGRPGVYQVAVYQWSETLLPSPLGYVRPGQETVWIPAPQVTRLVELEAQGRWPDVTVLDSYTGEPARLDDWADFLKTIRGEAISRYGRDSEQYDEFKTAFGMACSLMLGTRSAGQRREWKCELHRPDWTHALQSQASMTLHRWADECRMVTGNELAPVGLQNVDEMVIPSAALEIVTTVRRSATKPPLRIDQDGIKLGTFKVKRTEVCDDAA